MASYVESIAHVLDSAHSAASSVLAEGVNGSHNRVRCCRKEKSHAKYTECAFL
jgi:hypothetical protein